MKIIFGKCYKNQLRRKCSPIATEFRQAKHQLSAQYMAYMLGSLLASLLAGAILVYAADFIPDHPSEVIVWGGIIIWSSIVLPLAICLGLRNIPHTATPTKVSICIISSATPVIIMQVVCVLLFGAIAWLCNVLVVHKEINLPYYGGIWTLMKGILLESFLYSYVVLMVIYLFQPTRVWSAIFVSIGALLSGWIVILLLWNFM